MQKETITIPVKIDAKAFRRFAAFDTLYRQKRLKLPLIFAAIMLAFSVVCFMLNNGSNQAYLLGGVLLAVGLGLPAVYFGVYFHSVSQQAKQLKLQTPQLVYTLELSGAKDGVKIVSAKQEGGEVRRRWDSLYGVYRTKDSMYLYVTERQAFLLPNGQADASPEELWEFFKEHLPDDKLHGL